MASKATRKAVSDLSPVYQDLVQAAIAVSRNGYAPYSKFQVGAALLHFDGTVTPGCNWENCIYQGTCAERTAIVTANANGKRTAKAVAVYGKPIGAEPTGQTVLTPCGLCRQMLYEVYNHAPEHAAPLEVIMITGDQKEVELLPLPDLLPMAFGPKDAGMVL